MGELKSGMQILEFNIQGFDEETAPPSSQSRISSSSMEEPSPQPRPQAEEIEDEEPPPEEHGNSAGGQ